jgi:hypothetical protein
MPLWNSCETGSQQARFSKNFFTLLVLKGCSPPTFAFRFLYASAKIRL